MPLAPMLADLFVLSGPVARKKYAAWGFSLAIAKYGIDAAAVYGTQGVLWHPLRYFIPLGNRLPFPDSLRPLLLLVFVFWSLPFVWIGLVLTFRRTLDAGLSPWVSLLYFVPLANYVLMGVLCCLKSVPDRRGGVVIPGESPPLLPHAIRGALMAVGIALATLGLDVYVLHVYGAALYFGAPVVVGVVIAFMLNRPRPRAMSVTLGVVTWSILLAGAVILLFALEGLICIVMAAPLAIFGAVLGAIVGRAIAMAGPAPPYHALGVLAALPVLAGFEATVVPRPSRREVVSTVEIDAPPEKVWPMVLGFSELPPPAPWSIFRSGIAYPMRARIEGEGVGAVRHCEFSTGSFVEPITRFEPPTRLSFDVRSQPLPMRELSPYRIHPPHLDGYFRSVAGEFRLRPLEGGRTRLEGSTWYELEMAPVVYWSPLAEWLIHAIHMRVLSHIRVLATS